MSRHRTYGNYEDNRRRSLSPDLGFGSGRSHHERGGARGWGTRGRGRGSSSSRGDYPNQQEYRQDSFQLGYGGPHSSPQASNGGPRFDSNFSGSGGKFELYYILLYGTGRMGGSGELHDCPVCA